MLKKSEPSPLLPESDEEAGASRTVRRRQGEHKHRPPTPAVQIDFDGIQQRILAVAGVPSREYAQLKAGAAGTVFFLEAPTDPDARGNTLHRYRLSDRKSAIFLANVAEYAVSADGKKLVYRTPAPQAGPNAPPANPNRGPRSSWSTPPARTRRRPATAGSMSRCG